MNYTVDSETMSKTVCEKEFACLSGNEVSLCKVLHSVDDKMIFIKPGTQHCNYMDDFGYSNYCKCPTRIEIYRQYRV